CLLLPTESRRSETACALVAGIPRLPQCKTATRWIGSASPLPRSLLAGKNLRAIATVLADTSRARAADAVALAALRAAIAPGRDGAILLARAGAVLVRPSIN